MKSFNISVLDLWVFLVVSFWSPIWGAVKAFGYKMGEWETLGSIWEEYGAIYVVVPRKVSNEIEGDENEASPAGAANRDWPALFFKKDGLVLYFFYLSLEDTKYSVGYINGASPLWRFFSSLETSNLPLHKRRRGQFYLNSCCNWRHRFSWKSACKRSWSLWHQTVAMISVWHKLFSWWWWCGRHTHRW